MNKLRAASYLLVSLALSACAPAPTPVPTALPPAATETLVTPLAPALPATWTPGAPPSLTPVKVVSSPTRADSGLGPTLPPTWTASAVVTVSVPTRRPTFTPPPPTVTAAVSPTRNVQQGPPTPMTSVEFAVACQAFLRVSNGLLYGNFSQSVAIQWAVVGGADSYEVWLQGPTNQFIHRGTAPKESPFYEFSGRLFQRPGSYLWIVLPIKDGDRYCPDIEGEIRVG